MRKIKFRAWEKTLNEMIPVNNIDFIKQSINTDSAWRFFPEIELMQYTGLKDAKGVEIYEGDVIYFTEFDVLNNDKQYHAVVEYDESRAEFMLRIINSKQEEQFSLGWIHFQDDEIEVLGNRYENPELLEESK